VCCYLGSEFLNEFHRRDAEGAEKLFFSFTAQQLRCKNSIIMNYVVDGNHQCPQIGYLEDFSFSASQRKAKKYKPQGTLRLCGELYPIKYRASS